MAELEDVKQVEVEEHRDEPTYTPAEQKARSQGWVDQDEWVENGNDPDEWVDYKIFNVKGELFDKIKKQNKVLDEYRTVIQDLQRHNMELSKKENDKLKRQLKQQKEKAIEEGNGKAVSEIDDWLDELNEGGNAPAQNNQDIDPAITNSFNEWVSNNPWYNSDSELKEEADSIGIAEAIKITKNQRPLTASEAEELYEKVTKKVKRMYPEKFQNERKSKGSPVSSSNSSTQPKSSGNKSNFTIKDIPEEYRDVARRFEKSGVMTISEYGKQLKAMGEI